jgi:hypothetical protein
MKKIIVYIDKREDWPREKVIKLRQVFERQGYRSLGVIESIPTMKHYLGIVMTK